jgi:hypothetical protein
VAGLAVIGPAPARAFQGDALPAPRGGDHGTLLATWYEAALAFPEENPLGGDHSTLITTGTPVDSWAEVFGSLGEDVLKGLF